MERGDSVRENRADGSQTSVDLDWVAIKVHPADAYDGDQGDGYPPPTGARDEYTYTLHSTATGVYVVSATDMQMLDTSTIVQKLLSAYASTHPGEKGSNVPPEELTAAVDEAKRYIRLEMENERVDSFKSHGEEWQYETLKSWMNPKTWKDDEISIDDAVKYLDEHETGNKSKRKCATEIRKALEAGGFDTSGHPAAAKDYGDFLENHGFEEVDRNGYTPQKGDIGVVQPYPGGNTAGHIEMYDGDRWMSDFKQRNDIDPGNGIYPGGGYREYKPSYKIYRYDGGK